MTAPSNDDLRFALFIRIEANPAMVPETDGWRMLVESGDAAMLARFLRRQAPALSLAGGMGVLARVSAEEGEVEIRPLMDHTGAMRPEVAFRKLPKRMAPAGIAAWCELVETYLRELPREEPRPIVSAKGRKGLIPTMQDIDTLLRPFRAMRSRRGAYVATTLVGIAGCSGLWAVAAPTRAFTRQAQVPVTYGEDLAEGGTVRRLQGVAQAFGRRW